MFGFVHPRTISNRCHTQREKYLCVFVPQQRRQKMLSLRYALENYREMLAQLGRKVEYIWFVMNGCVEGSQRKVYV